VAHTIAGGGLKWEQGLSPPSPLTLTTGPKSRTERPRKTKIATEVAHVTRDSDTTFKVKSSKVKVTGPVWLTELADQYGHRVSRV